jgi:hypothetical protein
MVGAGDMVWVLVRLIPYEEYYLYLQVILVKG